METHDKNGNCNRGMYKDKYFFTKLEKKTVNVFFISVQSINKHILIYKKCIVHNFLVF